MTTRERILAILADRGPLAAETLLLLAYRPEPGDERWRRRAHQMLWSMEAVGAVSIAGPRRRGHSISGALVTPNWPRIRALMPETVTPEELAAIRGDPARIPAE